MKCFAASKKAGHAPALNDGFWPIVLKSRSFEPPAYWLLKTPFLSGRFFVSIADY
jgi:hypothetical protein